MSILNLLQHTTHPTTLRNLPEGFYETLVDALTIKNTQFVREQLAKLNRAEHQDPQIVGCFLKHFSEETMVVLFENMIGAREFFVILDATEVAPEDAWKWFIDERGLPVGYLVNHAVEKLKSSNLTEQQQQSVVHFFKAASPHVPANEFLSEIGPILNDPNAEGWAECIWAHLRTFTRDDWKALLETLDPENLLLNREPSSYKGLIASLQHIPYFQEAFDQYFENFNQQYCEFVQNFSSPKGIKHSMGFKQLPRDVQKRLHYEISQLYDPEDGLLIGKYKEILGYTNDELFLKNFGFDELDVEFDAPVLKILHKGLLPLHPLHTILQQPEGFLRFDTNTTDLIEQYLDHPLILQNVFDDMGPSDFVRILQRHPQLERWKDGKGNSLAHWCVVNLPFDQEWADVITQYPALLEPNHKGFTLREIVLRDVELGNVEDENMAALDHILISQAISEDIGTKIVRSRKM